MRSYRGNFGILQPWQEGAGNGSHWCQTLGQTAQCRRFGRGLMCTVDLTPFRMHRALLAFGSELASWQGQASKCRASRIRRRSGKHLAEAPALGGPMKDRLRRWLTPVVIDRTRRGTHDRADVTEPCRGCATAVSCRAASRTSRRACPCPVLPRTCTSVAQT